MVCPHLSHPQNVASMTPPLGHDFIDILKIDIESGEFDSLIPLLEAYVHPPSGPARPLPFGQLQLEIHAWNGRDRLDSFLPWFELMERAGLRPFRNEPNLVYLGWVKGSHPDLVEVSSTLIDSTWLRG